MIFKYNNYIEAGFNGAPADSCSVMATQRVSAPPIPGDIVGISK